MPDWIHTIEARAGGYQSGFLASDTPLEHQDLQYGGLEVPPPAADDDALDAMTKAELVAEAEIRGVAVDPSATKADILAALRAE